MAAYPSLEQCEGSTREDVSELLPDVSTNGTVRGREMFDAAAYRLTLVHKTSASADFTTWETFWDANRGSTIVVTWVVDSVSYTGVLESGPRAVWDNQRRRYELSVTLLVQKT